MNTQVQDIEMLERAILTEARDEAEQIKAEAKEKADAIESVPRNKQSRNGKPSWTALSEDAERLPQTGNRDSPVEGTFLELAKS